MTKRMLSYLRGAGQLLDWSGSYLDEVIVEIRESSSRRRSDVSSLRDDMNKVGEDFVRALKNIDPGMTDARKREQRYVD